MVRHHESPVPHGVVEAPGGRRAPVGRHRYPVPGRDPEDDRVLGDREEVSVGDDNRTAEIESAGGGRDVEEDRTFPDREVSGAGEGSSAGVDSQQAGFAAPEQVEDADLVREYNRRIREGDANDDDSDSGDPADDDSD